VFAKGPEHIVRGNDMPLPHCHHLAKVLDDGLAGSSSPPCLAKELQHFGTVLLHLHTGVDEILDLGSLMRGGITVRHPAGHLSSVKCIPDWLAEGKLNFKSPTLVQ